MSAAASTWVIGGALACFVLIMAASLALQDVLISREDAPVPTGAADSRLMSDVCDAPLERFTVSQAHRAMQLHAVCLMDECARKHRVGCPAQGRTCAPGCWADPGREVSRMVDDDWCDWCGEDIPGQTRRREDGRVFCCDECVGAYRRRSDLARAVVEFRPRS